LLHDLKNAIDLYASYFYDHKGENFAKIVRLREKIYALDDKKYDALNSTIISKTLSCFDLLVNLQDAGMHFSEDGQISSTFR